MASNSITSAIKSLTQARMSWAAYEAPTAGNGPELYRYLVELSKDMRSSRVDATTLASHVTAGIAAALETILHTKDPSMKALALIGKEIDAHPACRKPDYHNTPHYMDVDLTATALALRERKKPSPIFCLQGLNGQSDLTPQDVGDMAVVAALHDYLHTGGRNNVGDKYDYMEMEDMSFQAALPILKLAGYSGERLERIQILMYATDPKIGPCLTGAAMRYHLAGKDSAEQVFAYTEMSQLIRDAAPFLLPDRADVSRNRLQKLMDALVASPKTTGLAYLTTKSDIGLSASGIYLENAELLQKENKKNGGPDVLGRDGKPTKDMATYFFHKIVEATEAGFPLYSFEEVFGTPIRNLMHKMDIEIPTGTNRPYAQRAAAAANRSPAA